MALVDITNAAKDAGFQARVQSALIDVIRDKLVAGVGAGSEDEKYAWGALNGDVSIFQLALGVATLLTGDPLVATDAQIKTRLETVWAFYAAAWSNRETI